MRNTHHEMIQQMDLAHTAAVRQACAVAGGPMSAAVGGPSVAQAIGIGVDDFRRLCRLRISFVKGILKILKFEKNLFIFKNSP